MKETKVYINKMPESCWDCFCQDNENGRCKILGKYTDYVPKDCPLIDIKTHDRGLVEKVLEKTKTFVRENTYICGGNATREDIITSSSYNQALRDVLDFMETLQKEFKYD